MKLNTIYKIRVFKFLYIKKILIASFTRRRVCRALLVLFIVKHDKHCSLINVSIFARLLSRRISLNYVKHYILNYKVHIKLFRV